MTQRKFCERMLRAAVTGVKHPSYGFADSFDWSSSPSFRHAAASSGLPQYAAWSTVA